MKFLPTITLTNELQTALRHGNLKLQRGQWVLIPGSVKPSRFIAVRRSYLHIVHPDGPFASGTVKMARFQRHLQLCQE